MFFQQGWSSGAWIWSEHVPILPLPTTRSKEKPWLYCRRHCVSTVPKARCQMGWWWGDKSTVLTPGTSASQSEICTAPSTEEYTEGGACKYLHGENSTWSVCTNTGCTAWTHRKARPSNVVIIHWVITPRVSQAQLEDQTLFLKGWKDPSAPAGTGLSSEHLPPSAGCLHCKHFSS